MTITVSRAGRPRKPQPPLRDDPNGRFRLLVREFWGNNTAACARDLGQVQPNLHRVAHGQQLGTELLLAVASRTNVNMHWLLTGEGERFTDGAALCLRQASARKETLMALVAGRDYLFLVLGDRCWATGRSEKEARAKALASGGRKGLRNCVVYLVPPSAEVTAMGDITWKGTETLPAVRLRVVKDGREVDNHLPGDAP